MSFTYNGTHYDSIAAFRKSPAARGLAKAIKRTDAQKQLAKAIKRTDAQKQLAKAEQADLEQALATQIKQHGLPEPVTQFLLPGSDRLFKFDFAWPSYRLLVEVNGAVWVVGGHSTGGGILRDYAKANEAELHGWHQLTFGGDAVDDGSAVLLIQKFMHGYRQRVFSEYKVVSGTGSAR